METRGAGTESEAGQSIGALARQLGLTTRAIRFYEDKGLLTPRRVGQRRLYGPRERVRLQLIQRGKRLGFSLAEIREILDIYDESQDESAQLTHLVEKIAERRASLLAQRRDIDLTLDELDQLDTQCQALLERR
ncbi:MerR family transcriptional regulator [Roseospirillum parvum]|uniref:DNA-binding transcriptional regulator, MerR family n=1 Tax=Roseospirillum parvum TaxID=83401 RepID=A0A1G7U795_9PROT|nr:MerR family DNA-binding transcriptional regulator [Roseospirillum parvum]SDG43482.1 DNA-binding transcriptional regulator, MerR family [Roseospirillum parvum]